ncbi:TIGR00297 family protein [archaeon]
MDPWLFIPGLMTATALLTGGLDRLSAITGGVMGYMILFLGGWQWLLILALFFLLSTAATRYKYTTKSKYGLSQKKRAVENVLGNGLVPLAFAMQGNLIGFAAALATATGDTLSSEIGVLSKKAPVSVLDFKTPVKRGENGGVTLLGNGMMALGSGAVAVGCLLLFGNWVLFWTTLWGGIFGTMLDSVLGATLENEGVIGNHLVNLTATLGGGLMAIAVTSLF